MRGDLGKVRPQRFEGVPLDEGVRRLIGENRVNLMMRYEFDGAGEKRLVIAGAAGELPAEPTEQRRMRGKLARIRVPPPPPPPE
jgi:hypothetical protein